MSSISALANSNNQNLIWSLLSGGSGTAATPASATSASFQSQMQSWLTSLQSAASGSGTTAASTAAQSLSQGPTNTGDPDDTSAAAKSVQGGTGHHHHHHHGGGTESAGTDSIDGASPLSSSPTSGSIIGSTPGTSQTGGSLAQVLAGDVARAVQAYSSGASSLSGALSTIA